MTTVKKRGFNKIEAMEYLGVKVKFFDKYIMPLVRDKAVKAGVSLIFQRKDLDDAWERYTLSVDDGHAVNTPKGVIKWQKPKQQASVSTKTANFVLIQDTEKSEFLNAASTVSNKQ